MQAYTKKSLISMSWNDSELIRALREDKVAVMPTDTIYGIVGRAESPAVVERIYRLRRRAPEKPCIILIAGVADLEKFSVTLTSSQRANAAQYWRYSKGALPARPTSIVFDCPDERFAYLHRGTKTLAFRLPASEELRDLLAATGPLIAPSANWEGSPSAQTIEEAKRYFGEAVDYYADGGMLAGAASQVVRLHTDGGATILRA